MPKIKLIDNCVRCESPKTGVILYASVATSSPKLLVRNAKKGLYTLIKPKDFGQITDFFPNRFCADCCFEWYSDFMEKIVLSEDEYLELMKEKGLPTKIKKQKKTKKRNIATRLFSHKKIS